MRMNEKDTRLLITLYSSFHLVPWSHSCSWLLKRNGIDAEAEMCAKTGSSLASLGWAMP